MQFLEKRHVSGRLYRVWRRCFNVVESIDGEWYKIESKNKIGDTGVNPTRRKIHDGYVKIRDWNRGCDQVTLYDKLEE